MGLATYDPKQVVVTIGSHIVSGFGEDTFIEIETTEDLWTLTVGAGGDGARAKSNNESGTIVITLLQTSDSNNVLQGYLASDILSNSGAFPISVQDKNGTSLYAGAEAWVKKAPDASFGKSITDRQWTIETDKLVSATGGSTK